MLESPYNKGDTVSLNQEYEILKLITETEKYWLFDAIQTDILKKVKVLVYNEENFSSSIEVEMEWKSDVEIIQKESEFLDEKVDFIESGVKMDGGKLQYVIVFSSSEEISEAKPTSTPTSASTPVVTAKPDGIKTEGLGIARPKRTFLADIDDLDKADSEKPATTGTPVTSKDSEITVEAALKESKLEEESAEEDIVGEIKDIIEEDKESVMPEEIADAPAHPNEKEMAPASPPPTSGPSATFGRKKDKKESAFKESVPEKIEETTASAIEPIHDERPDGLEKAKDVIVEDDKEKDYIKFIAMDYFDRMNPSNYYPLKIKISDVKKAASPKMINPITGERKVTERDEIETTLTDSIVIVRPIMLGCSVMPEEIETDFDDEEDDLTFYVTPGVKGKVIGSIDFINEGETIHSTKFEAKVVDPNYARVVAFYGILTSFAPKIISLLGLNLGLDQTMGTLWGVTSGAFQNLSLAGLIALGGIVPVVIISLVVRWKLKPSEGKLKFNLTNFRLKDLKVKKTKA